MKLKPGYTTTEFLVTVGGIVIQAALAGMEMLDAGWAAMGSTVLAALYTVIRGSVKRGEQEVRAAELRLQSDSLKAGHP